jgi:hypothetical protein
MAGSLVQAEAWVGMVLVIPTAVVCATIIILVLAVERKDRVQAIKALPPIAIALGRSHRPCAVRRSPDLDGQRNGP